jgi:cytochrome c-type biogenesis protein CcmH
MFFKFCLTVDLVKDKPTAVQHQVVIKVILPERLRQAEFKEHYLMVYIKAVHGRPMPIAIQKIKLKDFTGTVASFCPKIIHFTKF